MFSSKGRDKDIVPVAPPAVPGSMQAKRIPRSSSAPSIISADLIVTGTLTSTGDIQIDGRVEGDVHSAGLVIGDKAFIHGDVMAEEVTVRGRVQGSIRARKVLLAPPAMWKATFCTKLSPSRPAPSSKAIAATRTIRWARKLPKRR